MKIVIPGGSGQVGTLLARTFHAEGHEVVALARRPRPTPWLSLAWDGASVGAWAGELDGADVVINLAGRSVNCRYTPAHRREILHSRLAATRAVGAAIARAARPPRAWLQASTATIYAHRFDAPNDEASGRIGGGELGAPASWRFSIQVAEAWEQAAREASIARTRLVLLRSAMIMSPDRGGIFDTLLGLVRHGLGGPVAGGRQYVSWMHDADFVRAVRWLIERDELRGAVNLAAPEPLPYVEFMRALRRAWGMPVGLPASAWMVAIGAWLLRTEPELALKSRRVIPGVLTRSGFAFQYPAWPDAAADLCRRWRAQRSR